MNVLSIDPGLMGTGVALWTNEGSALDWERIELPQNVWTYTPRGRTWQDRSQDCLMWLNYIYKVYNVIDTYCEWPQYFMGAIGHSATVRGDIHKLTYLIGGIAHLATYVHTGNMHLVPVVEWKGQLPKQVVINRIKQIYQKANLNINSIDIKSHGWDALGIGLYVKGVFH